MKKIKNNIKRLIQNKGFRQNYLAERLDMHDADFSSCIAGRRTLNKERTSKLANMLGCTMHDIYPEKYNKPTLRAFRLTIEDLLNKIGLEYSPDEIEPKLGELELKLHSVIKCKTNG